jgi:hypothetical protein
MIDGESHESHNCLMDAPKCKICGERHYGPICATKSSRGGGGSRPAQKRDRAPSGNAGLSGSDHHCGKPAVKGWHAGAGDAPLPVAGVAPGPREAKRKPGRPRAEDRGKTLAADKPWIAAGVSRASWYRRKAEKR